MWSGRTLIKYALIQIPGLVLFYVFLKVLDRWVSLSSGLIWILTGLWVAKDIFFYPFVWRAYEWHPDGEEHPMIGLRGIARERLNPSGQVHVRGEIWQAELLKGEDPIEKSEGISVQGIRGLTLLVVREPAEGDSD